MEKFKAFIKRDPAKLPLLREFFERYLKVEINLPQKIQGNDIEFAQAVNRIEVGVFKVQRVYGDPNYNEYNETPIIDYSMRVINPRKLKDIYQNAYELLYPDKISKFLLKNLECRWVCKDCNAYINTLDSKVKIESYITNFQSKNPTYCHAKGRHGNEFSISDDGKIVFF